jgi:AbrB family looped-hinge helix DNA binding protein
MRVTSKGQVTIPQRIRNKLGVHPNTEVEFVEEKDRVYLRKSQKGDLPASRFRKLRGVATVSMTTEQILALTRAD